MINVLDKNTIDQIAAGEVIERPASVVKELVENSIDAGATSVTVEIQNGGIDLIRITDDGQGINADEVATAFLRHATSKITKAEDLLSVKSLGFRGEALSSIAVISKVELLTKTEDAFSGTRYVIEGGEEIGLTPCGCPNGTTFLVKELFYNVPVRRKFLKSASTETGYIVEIMEKMALSNPAVNFKLISNGRVVLHTSGNGKLKDDILEIYGLETAKAMTEVSYRDEDHDITISGLCAKPILNKGSRDYESFFVNGRSVGCNIMRNAVEDAYKGYLMGHCYPVCAIFIDMPSEMVDVNVHPQKLELRFTDNEFVYNLVYTAVRDALAGKNMIVGHTLKDKEEKKEEIKQQKEELQAVKYEEPFLKKTEKIEETVASEVANDSEDDSIKNATFTRPVPAKLPEAKVDNLGESQTLREAVNEAVVADKSFFNDKIVEKPIKQFAEAVQADNTDKEVVSELETKSKIVEGVQQEFITDLYKERRKDFKLIGQLMRTYWVIEMDDTMYMIDQHAAHEKVLYEKTMRAFRQNQEVYVQKLLPPRIVSLSMKESNVLRSNLSLFLKFGFELEEFGDTDFKLTGTPFNMVDVDIDSVFKEILDNLMNERKADNPEIILDRIATISCKAAIKGNNNLSEEEAKVLIGDMLELEDPYHCPHGRPTTIAFTKYDLDRKFRRLV